MSNFQYPDPLPWPPTQAVPDTIIGKNGGTAGAPTLIATQVAPAVQPISAKNSVAPTVQSTVWPTPNAGPVFSTLRNTPPQVAMPSNPVWATPPNGPAVIAGPVIDQNVAVQAQTDASFRIYNSSIRAIGSPVQIPDPTQEPNT